ncbi:MAG TPA: hypothetical protein VH853_18965 [Polyangia bacterium]|jgi:hypothetical protein|nr:hypothetical protein [Polyangia bacterium]
MKAFAPSNCRGSALWIVRAAGLSALLSVGCAGGGSGGTTGAGGRGGTIGTGGSGTGGSASGGAIGAGGSGSGGSGSGGSGSGGSGSGGVTGAGGSNISGVAGSSGAAGSGGSGGSAGSVGTGGVGGGPGSGGGTAGGGTASHCAARPGLLYCDDFENDTPGAPPSPWTTSINGAGTVTIDGTDPAASGTKSVHIQDGDGDYDTLLAFHDTAVLPSTTGRIYVRFYIRLAKAMTAGHNSFVLGDLFASPGNANSLRFSEDNQMFAESIGGDAQGAMSNNDFYSDGNIIGPGLVAGQWACVELLLDHAAPAIDVWLNDTEIPDLRSTKWAIDAYDYLRFGFEKYAGPSSEIWYDDIAIGTQQIGCY